MAVDGRRPPSVEFDCRGAPPTAEAPPPYEAEWRAGMAAHVRSVDADLRAIDGRIESSTDETGAVTVRLILRCWDEDERLDPAPPPS